MNLPTFDCFRDSIAIYFHKLRATQRSHFHWEHPLHYLDCRLVATIYIIIAILTSLIIGLFDYSIIGFIIIINFGYLVEPMKFFSTSLFMHFFLCNLFFVSLFAIYKGIPCENLSPNWIQTWRQPQFLVEGSRTLRTVLILLSAQNCITLCSRNFCICYCCGFFHFRFKLYLVSSERWTNHYNRSCGWHNFIRREWDLTGRTHRPLTTTIKREKEKESLFWIHIDNKTVVRSKRLMEWTFENV